MVVIKGAIMNLIKRIKHALGLCYKSRCGYNCHGTDNYQECGKK